MSAPTRLSMLPRLEKVGLEVPGMAGSLTAAVLSQLVLVASGVVVARALGPEDRGVLGLVFVLAALTTQLGSLGVPASVTYWIAGEGVSPRTVLRGLRALRSAQFAVSLGVHAALIILVLEPRGPSGFLWVALVSVLLTASGLSLRYGLAVLQGVRRFRAFNSLRTLNPVLYVVGVVVLWAVDRANLTLIALVGICASVLAATTTWVVVRSQLRNASDSREIATRPILSFGLRSLAGSAPPLEIFRLDQLLIGLVLSPAALGYYIVAQAFTNLTRFVGQSIGMVTYPRVAAATTLSQRALMRRDFLLGIGICGGATLCLILAVPWLLPFFFGREFMPAGVTAQILLVAAFFASVRRILVDGTRGMGWPMWGAVAESLTLLALPAVVVATHHTHSLAAAATAIAAANFVGLLVIAPALRTAPRPEGDKRSADSKPSSLLVGGKASGQRLPLRGDPSAGPTTP